MPGGFTARSDGPHPSSGAGRSDRIVRSGPRTGVTNSHGELVEFGNTNGTWGAGRAAWEKGRISVTFRRLTSVPLPRLPSFTGFWSYWIDAPLPLHCHGNRVASAEAQSGNTPMHVLADHFVDQRNQNPRTAGSDGMS